MRRRTTHPAGPYSTARLTRKLAWPLAYTLGHRFLQTLVCRTIRPTQPLVPLSAIKLVRVRHRNSSVARKNGMTWYDHGFLAAGGFLTRRMQEPTQRIS